MKNKKISANEINKFCYCNYQWYYEKIYGSSEIKRLNAKYKEENGIKSSTSKNLRRGVKFHNQYVFKYKIKRFFKLVLFFIVITLIIYGLYYFKIFDFGVLLWN